ncbi:MAG: hypothetical protein U5K76_12130 [Woeseiaceae bacterium]|nr:hypothetical protein [Woeseiaceae bacterium]
MLRRVSVIVSVPLLTSVVNAGDVMKRTRRPAIPADIVARIRDSKKIRQDDLEICADTLREVNKIPGVAGANIVAIEDCDGAVEVISLSGIRAGQSDPDKA